MTKEVSRQRQTTTSTTTTMGSECRSFTILIFTYRRRRHRRIRRCRRCLFEWNEPKDERNTE